MNKPFLTVERPSATLRFLLRLGAMADLTEVSPGVGDGRGDAVGQFKWLGNGRKGTILSSEDERKEQMRK